MTVVTFTVPGTPVGKGRPRFVRATGRVYTPTETLSAEGRIAHAFTQTGAQRIDSGPVFLDVLAILDRPRSHYTKAGALNAAGRANWWCLRKPDGDNLVKLVMDSLNGVAYRDDVQVVDHHVHRRWAQTGEVAGLTITLSTAATEFVPMIEGLAA